MKAIVDLAVITLAPVLYVLLLGGAILGLAIGITLLVDSERVMRWNAALNRWYSTRQAFQKLEEPIDVKRVIYRWHRVAGVLVFAGAIFTLDVLVFTYHSGALVRAFRGVGNPVILGILFETMRIVLIIGNVAAVVAGAILCFRPSLLKGVETVGDRYYSGREAMKPLEVMHYQPDEFVRGRPKLVGTVLIIGSAYVMIVLGLLLF
ncbi:MAG TPA: hypothetical protein VLF42_14725 [Burkholderiales bacterium]|nr:hypothetical protein [Burkholderiales bacterium]